MLISIYNKVKQGIKYHGYIYFLKLTITEQFYNLKFYTLSINYSEDNLCKEALNRLSINKDSKINQASPHYEIKKAFAFIGLDKSEIFLLDIGCGFGKVLNWGILLNCKEVIGIDLDEAAIEKAKKNCYKLQRRGYTTKYNIFNTDATKFPIPKDVNLIYIANSFGEKTMKQVLENILNHSKCNNNKEIFFVYYLPIQDDLLYSYKEITKIYEKFSGNKTRSEMAIYKISKI
jgi:SAM-dependent methyltransferase